MLATNASDYNVRAAFLHKYDNGIKTASQLLLRCKKLQSEKEVLAIHIRCEKNSIDLFTENVLSTNG